MFKATVKDMIMQNRREVWNDTSTTKHLKGKIFSLLVLDIFTDTFSGKKKIYVCFLICLIFKKHTSWCNFPKNRNVLLNENSDLAMK